MKWALLGGTGQVPSKTIHLHSNGFIVLVAGAEISLLPAGRGDTGWGTSAAVSSLGEEAALLLPPVLLMAQETDGHCPW